MYNRLCIIIYKKFFIVLLSFKRCKITRKILHFAMKIIPANVLLVVVIVLNIILYQQKRVIDRY